MNYKHYFMFFFAKIVIISCNEQKIMNISFCMFFSLFSVFFYSFCMFMFLHKLMNISSCFFLQKSLNSSSSFIAINHEHYFTVFWKNHNISLWFFFCKIINISSCLFSKIMNRRSWYFAKSSFCKKSWTLFHCLFSKKIMDISSVF